MHQLLLCIAFCFLSTVYCQSRSGPIVAALQSHYYDNSDGLWNTTGWWNSANSLEALVEYTMYTNDRSHIGAIQTTFQKTSTGQTMGEYFDDAQWWVIAWARAYELTHDKNYLTRSEAVWNYVVREAWDGKCGGGVYWNRDKKYKNAITNELFLMTSTLLYMNTNNETYLNWAKREWSWFESTGMLNNQHLINDGLDSNCKNNGQTEWTYNQGVILGGLHNLAKLTNNASLNNIATQIADAVYTKLVYSAGGILREPCETFETTIGGVGDCGNDGPQFKGIFMRYLGILTKDLQGAEKDKFSAWVKRNADSIWNNDRNGDNLCGLKWTGPSNQATTAATQTSALDCFNAERLLFG